MCCAFCVPFPFRSYHSSPDDTRRTVQVEEPSSPPLLSPLFFVKDWIPCKQKGVTDKFSLWCVIIIPNPLVMRVLQMQVRNTHSLPSGA